MRARRLGDVESDSGGGGSALPAAPAAALPITSVAAPVADGRKPSPFRETVVVVSTVSMVVKVSHSSFPRARFRWEFFEAK